MKQVLLTHKDHLEIVEAKAPPCPQGGVVVAMQAAGICRTDIKMLRKGQKDLVLPRILGHEGTGLIVESENARLPVGTNVAVYPGIFCAKCPACHSGQTGRCRHIRVLGFNQDGLWQTLVPFGETQLSSLIPLSKAVAPVTMIFAEPLACCLNAIKKFNNLNRGVAVVIGAGAAGSLFAALLKSTGFRDIFIADIDRRRLAREMPPGVRPLYVADAPIAKRLTDAGIYGQIDFLVAACAGGLAWPFWEAMNTSGAVSLFSGGDDGEACQPVDLNICHYRELALAGAYGCNLADFQEAVELLIDGNVDVSFFQPCRLELSQINTGIELLERRQTKKVIIEFQEVISWSSRNRN